MVASPRCTHSRTRLVAQDSDAEYRECLDCGAILEKAELPAVSVTHAASSGNAAHGAPAGNAAPKEAGAEKPGFDESLSDA
jgi:hypothetical protein